MAKEVVYSHGDIMENYSLYDNYTLEELIKARSKLTSDSKPETLDYLNKLIAKKQREHRSKLFDKSHSEDATISKSTEVHTSAIKHSQPQSAKVLFHGKTGEYFAIWIVNILLSIKM